MSGSYFNQNPWGNKENFLTQTISVTSGKGGVGKSTLVANLALQLAKRNKKILILDGDLGMANVDIMFGVRTHHSVEHVLSGECTLQEILVEVAPQVYLIPGGSGIYGLQNLDIFQKRSLLDQVNSLDDSFDFLIIDTASGIDENVLYLNSAAQETLVVVTPDPSSMTDAYALIKVLHQRYHESKFSVVVNMSQNETDALNIFKRLSDVAQKFLCVSLSYKGFIPNDVHLRSATISQQLIVKAAPGSASSIAIDHLAENLSRNGYLNQPKGGMQFFWEQLVGVA